MARVGMTLLALLLAAGCGGPKPTEATPPAPPPPIPPDLERIVLGGPVAAFSGLSGLTRTPDGRLWSVPETHGALLSFGADGSAPRAHDLAGVPSDLDIESLASWRGGFLAGSESQRADGGDVILEITRDGDRWRLSDRVSIDYARWKMRGLANQGIEGLCAAGDTVLAAIEATTGTGASRAAPLAVLDWRERRITAAALRLTTDTGKIAALDCEADGQGLSVVALERHFEVARVLAFRVDLQALVDGSVLEPTVVLDWAGQKRRRDNPEGVVLLPDSYAVVLDNDFGGAQGPNMLLRLPRARENHSASAASLR